MWFLFQEQLRQALEQKLNQTVVSLSSEKEVLEVSARERERKLLASRDQLILQHDEAMLRAENDKQQALLMGTLIIFLQWYCWTFI